MPSQVSFPGSFVITQGAGESTLPCSMHFLQTLGPCGPCLPGLPWTLKTHQVLLMDLDIVLVLLHMGVKNFITKAA